MAVSLRHAARTQGKGGATINALAAKGHIERDSGVLTVRRRPRVRVRACTHITCARVQLTGTAAEVAASVVALNAELARAGVELLQV